MSTKGHASQGRISHDGSNENYASVVRTDPKNRAGLDVLPKAIYKVSLVPSVAEALDVENYKSTTNPELRIVKLTGHSAKKGDVIRFDTGMNKSMEISVEKVTTDHIFLAGEMLVDPVGEDFFIMRHITLTISEDGELITSSGPVQFVKDSIATQVNEDTVTPANNEALPTRMFINKDGVQTEIYKDTGTPTNTVPVPVEIVSASGTEINITAGDINVQTTHLGANADSMRIGDGTNEMAVNVDNEAQVRDDDLNTAIGTQADALEDDPLVDASVISYIRGQLSELNNINTKLDTISAGTSKLNVVDQVDGNIIDVSSTNIPASAAGYLEIVASLASDVKEIQVIEDIGEFIGLYIGAASFETFLCVLPQGFTGSILPVQIPLGTRLSVRNMKNATIATDTRLAINFLG